MSSVLTIPSRFRPLAVIGLAVAAALAANALRNVVIEPEAMGAACRLVQAEPFPWWCGPRTALIVVTEVGGLGLGALALAALALFISGRRAWAALFAAAALGGAGLFLYNAYWAGTALLVLALRAARLAAPRQS